MHCYSGREIGSIIDNLPLVCSSQLDDRSNVSETENTGRDVRHNVCQITNGIEPYPSLCKLLWHLLPRKNGAKITSWASESITGDSIRVLFTAEIGAVEPNILMSKCCDSGTMAVSTDINLGIFGIGNRIFDKRLD